MQGICSMHPNSILILKSTYTDVGVGWEEGGGGGGGGRNGLKKLITGLAKCLNVQSQLSNTWYLSSREVIILFRYFHIATAQPTLTAYDQAPHLEWRYSFSQPEIELADCIPGAAREAFLALKAVNKAHMHSKSDLIPNLSSYILKSILLRVTEQHSPEDWGQLGADDMLRELLENLHQALTTGICPHFWIEDINLLEDLPKWRLTELATKVEQIQRNPHRYVADNWLEMTRCLRFYCFYCGPMGRKKGKASTPCCHTRCLIPCSYMDIKNRTCCPCPYDNINFEVYWVTSLQKD